MNKGKLDLKTPCKNCPFRADEHAIRFHDEMRALGIYLSAQRHGFPCHKSADLREYEDGGDGYVFAEDGTTQHCVGALIMMAREGHIWTEGTGTSREVFEALRERMNSGAPVFNNVGEFLEANRGKR